jgi:phospho-N-acetylmuramoyl-pentapeptide-transferase
MEAFLVVLKILTLGILNIFISLLIFPLIILFLNKIKAKKEVFKENAPIFQSLHAKKSGTPTMGGLIFWISPLVLILFLSFISFLNVEFGKWINFLNRRETYLPLGFLVLGGIIGAIDDLLGIFAFKNRRGLQIKEKLLIYFGFSLMVVWWFITKLGIKYIYIPFLGRYYLSFFWFALFMIIYIIAVSFSANETDGLDGLLGGVSLSILGVLGVISFINGNYNLASLTVVIMSAVLCFLWYNIYPAKIFMAIVSLLEGVYFLIPIIAPVFVIESGSVILQTLSKKIFKKKIFLSTPIHHHFEAKGLHEANIVFKFWIINAIGAAIGLIIFLLDKLI